MRLVSKLFDELTPRELYELLRSRSEVFVVEQKCAYQDIDGRDYESLHVFYEEDGRVVAYLRVYPKEPGTVQMGRVLTLRRGVGLGARLLHEGIRLVHETMNAERIFIEAQTYAVGFYEREGFAVCSDEFLEDGIPHVEMTLRLKDWKP